jgi:hypothetical protein
MEHDSAHRRGHRVEPFHGLTGDRARFIGLFLGWAVDLGVDSLGEERWTQDFWGRWLGLRLYLGRCPRLVCVAPLGLGSYWGGDRARFVLVVSILCG